MVNIFGWFIIVVALGWSTYALLAWERNLDRREAELERLRNQPNMVFLEGYEPGQRVLLELDEDGKTWVAVPEPADG